MSGEDPDFPLLRDSLAEPPVVDRGEYQYFVHPVTDGIPEVSPDLLEEVARGIADVADLAAADRVLAPEAMGIHHATALALETRIPFAVVRKRSYGLEGELAVHQETGYSEGELYVNGVDPGDSVVVVDDVLSTGGTLGPLCVALLDHGVDVVDCVVVFRRGEPDADLPVDVTHLLAVDVVDGEVVVVE